MGWARSTARFEREAQILASLNHPHIAGIYGVLVEAELKLRLHWSTVRRWRTGPIPLEEALTIRYAAMYDGRDYKYEGSPDADTIALKEVDANTTEATLKKAGKVTLTTRAVMAPDGKTRTLTTTGVDAKGQKVHNVVVLERQ